MTGVAYDIELADVDNDNHIEIVTSTLSNVYVFDGITHQTKWTNDIRAFALEVSDIDGDGIRKS